MKSLPDHCALWLLAIALAGSGRVCAQEPVAAGQTLLSAGQAKVTGVLKILIRTNGPTIHYWNKTNDTISWTWSNAKPGNYRAELNYALTNRWIGGKMSLVAGDQEIIAPAEPTERWSYYRTFELGVMHVEKCGDIPVMLRAAQLPAGNHPAMPDVAWLSFTPVDRPATSKPR